MHPLYTKADSLTGQVIGAAIEAENMDYYKAQTLSYLKFANKPLGLVINFHNPKLAEYGVRRVILKGANK